MKQQFFILFIAAGIFTMTACKKNHSDGTIDAGNVPHKRVPDPFTGDFSWTHVSSSGYNDAYGGAYSSLTAGSKLHMNRDGTGLYVFRYDVNYPNGGHKNVHIDCDVAYEITATSESTVDILVHIIRGKNYEDDVFLHDLDASKIYPNGDFTWTDCEYGQDDLGRTYFKHGSDNTYTKS